MINSPTLFPLFFSCKTFLQWKGGLKFLVLPDADSAELVPVDRVSEGISTITTCTLHALTIIFFFFFKVYCALRGRANKQIRCMVLGGGGGAELF